MWLTREELCDMTDLERPDAIQRWLTANGYTFEVSAKGWPKVLRATVESRHGISPQQPKRPRLHLAR